MILEDFEQQVRALSAGLFALNNVPDGFGSNRFSAHEQLVPCLMDLCL